MAKKKTTKQEPTMGATTSIVLNVPNPIYYEISDEVTAQKRAGNKSTIHDNMVERLVSTTKKKTK